MEERSGCRASRMLIFPDSAVSWCTITSGSASPTTLATASGSRASATTDCAPNARSPSCFDAVLVMPTTWWPAATSWGTNCAPSAPEAPATKTFMATPNSSQSPYRDEMALPRVTLPTGQTTAADHRDYRGQPAALAPRSVPSRRDLGRDDKGDVPIRSFCHRAPCLPTSLMGRRRPILHPHVCPLRRAAARPILHPHVHARCGRPLPALSPVQNAEDARSADLRRLAASLIGTHEGRAPATLVGASGHAPAPQAHDERPAIGDDDDVMRDFTPGDQTAVRELVLGGMRERWGDAYDPRPIRTWTTFRR